MQNILTLKESDFNPTAPKHPESEYKLREAARAVLFNDQGQVYLMNVSKHGYHKLPGGGIDTGENVETALERELLEEVGCRAEVQMELGMITEYRPVWGLQKQLSYCFIAKQTGPQEPSALEAGELAEGLVEVLATDLPAAIQLLEQDKPDNVEGQFIQARDLAFLRKAREILQ